jgi:pimeloyl-ACP methyl ester carboxylesterase
MIARMYQPRRPARSEFIPVRGLQYHVLTWGEPTTARPPLVLLHGWMDVAASWQFVVDAFAEDRQVIAPDWRGFGLTDGGGIDNYWIADYMADLDWVLDHYAGDVAADLVGHSMGGNVVMQYAGVKPQRVRRLVNLEGFGMPAAQADDAPARYGKWIDEIKRMHRGELDLHPYVSLEGVARRLMKTNPRLTADKAHWLASRWARETATADGRSQWKILGEPGHKITSAQNYRLDEVLAMYRRITAPVLVVLAEDDLLARMWKDRYTQAQYHERLRSVPDARVAEVADAGHMLHHDQPERVAALIGEFFAG